LKEFAIPINTSLSLICKHLPKINLTLLPNLLVLFSIETLNAESPVTNPDIQNGFGIPLNLYSGLTTGIILGKASKNSFGKPLFKLNYKAKIFSKPSCVKCSFCLINS